MKKLVFGVVMIACLSTVVSGQDAHFSQFYSNPMHLNPSMAGAGLCGGRFNMSYRDQWPGIPNAYKTFGASYDQSLGDQKGGFGVMFLNDVAGDGQLTTNHISAAYAYRITLNRNWQIQAGLQGSYVERSVDWSKLRFGDQIVLPQGFVKPTSEIFPSDKISYASVSSGITLFSKTFFAGLAVHHINEPSQSFFSNSEEGTYLPRKFTFHAGANFKSARRPGQEDAWVFSPNILFMQQEKFTQMNLGFYFNRGPLITGLWYRQTYPNADALVALLGVRFGDFQMGYSYDITISDARAITAGAHELSVSYRFCLRSRPKINWLDDVCPRL